MVHFEVEKLKKCYKYRDYDSAIFLSIHLSSYNNEFKLLTGILLYENQEYSRSIFYLKELKYTTAYFYLALNYKRLKKYSEAIVCLSMISGKKMDEDIVSDPFINSFIIHHADSEYIDSLIGELHILRGRSKTGIEKYRKSVLKAPLLKPIMALCDENIRIEPINDFLNDPIMNLYQNMFELNLEFLQTVNSLSNDKIFNISEILLIFPALNGYIETIPGIETYILSKLATTYCKYGQMTLGLEIYELLRRGDPCYIFEMDFYSNILWKTKNENLLGLLAKDLISTHPSSHITWTVIGNYYSYKSMPKESTLCFIKSLSILESSLAYALLGFEYNSRNQYSEAQIYFKSSICMLENNDKAYFGLGITLNETFKYQAAEGYFKKALELNSRCMHMKAYLVRFYIRQNKIDIGIERAREYLGIKTEDFFEILRFIECKYGKFNEMEDLILCEMVEAFIKLQKKDIAKKILDCIVNKTSSFFSKKALLETEN